MGLTDPTTKRHRPVLQFSLNGEFIKEWKSGRFAARELNMSETTISATALGKHGRKQSGGFIWKFKDLVPVVQN